MQTDIFAKIFQVPFLSDNLKLWAEPLILTGFAGIMLLSLGFFKADGTTEADITPQITEKQSINIIPDTIIRSRADSLKKADSGLAMVADTYTGLEPFFEALAAISRQNSTIHIAYFGDSMIEGDLVTHPLRRRFQLRFGGRGIGFIPVTSPQPGFRTTINHHFNDKWETYSFNHSGLSKGYFPGFSGYVFKAVDNARVTYTSEAGYGLFKEVTILYSGEKETMINVETDTAGRNILLPSSENVSAYHIQSDSAFEKLNLTVKSPAGGLLYGVVFENGPGVYVDNYTFRGNSGLPLRQIPLGTFSRLNQLLNNKLIILHFGLNVFTPGVSDYHWYEEAISGVIGHVKAASPGAGILVVSMPDRAALIDGAYYTAAELPDFIRLQQRVAEKNQVAFFSLFDAMGGVNSMKTWVEASPRLAGEDYTHPNSAGAGRVASLIFQYLMTGYDRYLENQSPQFPQPIQQP